MESRRRGKLEKTEAGEGTEEDSKLSKEGGQIEHRGAGRRGEGASQGKVEEEGVELKKRRERGGTSTKRGRVQGAGARRRNDRRRILRDDASLGEGKADTHFSIGCDC